MAVDGQGRVFVADSGNRRIQKFDASGNFLATWSTWLPRGEHFYDPVSVAVDLRGRLFVADGLNGSRILGFLNPSPANPATLELLLLAD